MDPWSVAYVQKAGTSPITSPLSLLSKGKFRLCVYLFVFVVFSTLWAKDVGDGYSSCPVY